ncbi:unnamed protein product [Aphanomyces euteiches]|uniref:Uncharacterized protein n=1 Tax=Aphanomyces euteiches TaxID=100861 RepID=A0A6G0XLX1_9STRA|nr:hypothetical protein Ae201684_003545 [Aphanomyces euteiches]KAH9071766.1 hypothetical protein Ae201684P_020206 [Aphanomyces euteiches]KAH9150266.1 hypothetical protein AeRB84_006857 [Aphanomyces euteiches]
MLSAWYQLVDGQKGAAYNGTTVAKVTISSVSNVYDFRDAVYAKNLRKLSAYYANDLLVFTNIHVNTLITLEDPIQKYGGSPENALVVRVPSRESGVQLSYLNGMNRSAPHLARTELVEHVFEKMQSSRQRFFHFVSPRASGKTSLLQLYADRYPHVNCIYISFLVPDQWAVELLLSCRIDVDGETASLDPNQDHVVMVDDAQAKYDETGFWPKLVKVASMWLPDNIRFIICATHALEGGVASPVEFQSLLHVLAL